MSDKGYRNVFGRSFDWCMFNWTLVKENCGKEILAVFDPSYLKKSGKPTYGIGYYWSGVNQCVKRGLEIGCLAFVDVASRTALHGIAKQTPGKNDLAKLKKNQVQHYVGIIMERIDDIKKLTRYLAVDGYFMKREFILPIVNAGLHIVTKARSDANFNYVYKGLKSRTKGRPKVHDGKVDIHKLDKRRFKRYDLKGRTTIYAGQVYCVVLKRIVMAAFIYYNGKPQPEIIICTDPQICPLKMGDYYGLRFQIEFLIRDAKQHTGLEDCMARDQKKLESHFNISMTTVSVAKDA
jgi:hypothetical protein